MNVADYVRSIVRESPVGVPETTGYPALKTLIDAVGDDMKPKVVLIEDNGA
jgi:hypothetical protein